MHLYICLFPGMREYISIPEKVGRSSLLILKRFRLLHTGLVGERLESVY